ncbi:MAG: poly(A) polymerase, partial [Solirubrobacteraceae bacterium]|nr:poly(A) polymerase [Solirubrobacteraceae bacterium]
MSAPLDEVRRALAGERAWLVGGAVRDRLLGRATDDLDVALDGDASTAAKALRRATGGAAFPLSETFGGWRVVDRGHGWHVDVLPLLGGDLATDLAARDFTFNAMAEPLAGGPLIDPHGGRADLAARVIRVVGAGALEADPLRAIRAVRFAAELGCTIEPATLAAVRAHAPLLVGVAPERVYAELRRIVGAAEPAAAVQLMTGAGVTGAVLPELLELRGVEQNVYHHADVYGHTLEVLGAAAELERDPSILGDQAAAVASALAEPLGDELTRWGGLRFAALLHDIAKPATRGERPGGGVSFIGHDREGAEIARAILRRLRASGRLADHVAALTEHHLRLGFLVHEHPLTRRSVYRYLTTTAPRAVDVTVLTVADRLATRGRNAEPAIEAHLALARTMLAEAFAFAPPRRPLIRGDQLAR